MESPTVPEPYPRPTTGPFRRLARCLRTVGGWVLRGYCRDLAHLAWTFDPGTEAAPAVAGPHGAHPERPAGHLPLTAAERALWADLTATAPGTPWRALHAGRLGDPDGAWSGWLAGRTSDRPW